MNDLTVFNFEANEVRVIDQNGEPWFVLRDVLQAMGSSTPPNVAKASVIDGLGEGYNNVIPLQTAGGTQQTTIISEPAVTFLVSRSNTDTGKRLNRWIHAEVLPSIRKTGSYGLPQVKDPSLAAHVKTLIELDIVKQEQQRIAMEVSDNTRRLDQIETAHDHFTVMGYMTYITRKSVDLNQAKAIGKKATKLCKDRGIDIGHVPDPRFGRVHTYPKFLLDEIVG